MNILLLMHFSVFLAGFTGLLGRAISVDSYSIVFWRMLFAVVCYALFVFFFHPLRHLSRSFILKSMLVGATLMVHLVFFLFVDKAQQCIYWSNYALLYGLFYSYA